jgi:O-antigen ligase
MFVATSRTALVYIPILAALFVIRWFSIKAAVLVLSMTVLVAPLVWFASPYLRWRVEHVRAEYLDYRDANLPTSTGMRLAWWRESLDFVADAPVFGNGTGSTKRLLNKDGSEKTGLFSGSIRNPHNQTLYVAIQWGLLGCLVLYAMWFYHVMLFRGVGIASWIGLVVVIQNILSSIFNSHLFDFTEGWIYVLGVGAAGGCVLKNQLRHDTSSAGEVTCQSD